MPPYQRCTCWPTHKTMVAVSIVASLDITAADLLQTSLLLVRFACLSGHKNSMLHSIMNSIYSIFLGIYQPFMNLVPRKGIHKISSATHFICMPACMVLHAHSSLYIYIATFKGGLGGSLASQPYFSLFPVGGARGREKYVWTLWPAFRATKECVQKLQVTCTECKFFFL